MFHQVNNNIISKMPGFTIIELMIVVTIAGVLAALALPNYQNLVADNCIVSNTNILIGSFQLARSESAKRNVIIKITTKNTATPTNEWGGGWDIWEDENNNGTLELWQNIARQSERIRSVVIPCGTGDINLDDVADRTEYHYLPNGFIRKIGNLTNNIEIQLCDNRTGELGRSIAISRTGRPSYQTYTCS